MSIHGCRTAFGRVFEALDMTSGWKLGHLAWRIYDPGEGGGDMLSISVAGDEYENLKIFA